MEDASRLALRIRPSADEDLDKLADLTAQLRVELLELDTVSVEPPEAADLPGAKGLGSVIGWLFVQLRSAEALHAVLGALRNWSARTERTIEVSYGTEALKASGLTADLQEKIVDAWLAAHSAGA
jgi:hypothetical protein